MKVLIVGLGSIARKHISAMKDISEEIEIFALRSSKCEDEFGITNLFDFQNLEKYNFDFVIISTPTFLHEQNLKDLSYLKIPFFIEKPISQDLKITKIVPLYKENLTYVACNLRFLDSLKYFKENYDLENLRINEINVYAGSYLPNWRPGINYKDNYSALPEKGGGVHIDLIHEIDYIYWFFGKPLKKNAIFKSKSSIEIESYDYANYILEYENFTASVILNYYRRDSKRFIEILTDEKTIKIDLLKNEIYENEVSVFKSEQKIIDTYKIQLEYFINLVKNNQNSTNSIEDGLEVLKICIE